MHQLRYRETGGDAERQGGDRLAAREAGEVVQHVRYVGRDNIVRQVIEVVGSRVAIGAQLREIVEGFTEMPGRLGELDYLVGTGALTAVGERGCQ